jgi:hypothetical protein
MDDSHLGYTHYALLIGINAYSETPLKGCVRDVLGIKKHLENIADSSNVHIRTLTAELPDDTRNHLPIEEQESLPTRNNVIDAMEWIISRAKEGDFVYIHYAGHGTAFRPGVGKGSFSEFSNRSTGDLALNLLDEDTSKICYLRGYELASRLRDMVDKKLIVTVVLDCCFSGGVMRNDTSIRYRDYDPHIDAAYPPISWANIRSEDEPRRSAFRDASLRPNWLVNPDGYTIFTACGPTESSGERRIGDQVHGLLSYFLTELFEKLGGIGGTQHYIYQRLRARFRNTRESHRHNQNPMLYGNKSLLFFGLANARIGPAPITVFRDQSGGFKLEAGQAHGICVGDEFAIRPTTSTSTIRGELVDQENPVTAVVTSVGALTSALRLSDVHVISNATLAATPLSHLSLRNFPIRLELDMSEVETWTKALIEHPSLNVYQACSENEGRRASFVVAMPGHGCYEIRDHAGCMLLRQPVSSPGSYEDAVQVLESVEHLAKFELVRSVTNNSVDDSTISFRMSFSVQIVKPSGGRIDPGCRKTRQNQSICSHPECLVEVGDGTELYLEVKNNEEKGGYALCVHTYNLGSSWEVVNCHHGDYEVVPALPLKEDNPHFMKGPSGLWRKKMTMKIPKEEKAKGITQCDDIIKIFLTSQPISFLSLELPELDQPKKHKKLGKYRGTGSFRPSEDWIAVSFRIRTRIKGA